MVSSPAPPEASSNPLRVLFSPAEPARWVLGDRSTLTAALRPVKRRASTPSPASMMSPVGVPASSTTRSSPAPAVTRSAPGPGVRVCGPSPAVRTSSPAPPSSRTPPASVSLPSPPLTVPPDTSVSLPVPPSTVPIAPSRTVSSPSPARTTSDVLGHHTEPSACAVQQLRVAAARRRRG